MFVYCGVGGALVCNFLFWRVQGLRFRVLGLGGLVSRGLGFRVKG